MKRWLYRIAVAGVVIGMVAFRAQGQPPPFPPRPPKESPLKRVERVLRRIGLKETEITEVLRVGRERFHAIRRFIVARRELERVVYRDIFQDGGKLTEEELKGFIARYRETMQWIQKRFRELDERLDKAIHYSTRPEVEAALLTLGLIGPPEGTLQATLMWRSRRGRPPFPRRPRRERRPPHH